jgi:hypothetical protein
MFERRLVRHIKSHNALCLFYAYQTLCPFYAYQMAFFMFQRPGMRSAEREEIERARAKERRHSKSDIKVAFFGFSDPYTTH